jgi:hypothetical protein
LDQRNLYYGQKEGKHHFFQVQLTLS